MSAAATPTPTALTPGPMWINDHNYGPLVSIITWFLIITSFLSVFARIGTRMAVVKKLYADDITILIALLFSIGQSICVSLEVTHGLGKPGKTQTPENLEKFQKEFFAGSMLYIAVLTLIKVSVCLYLTNLTPVRLQKTIVLVTGSFILLWGISSMFILGFQCSLPHTWNTFRGKCIDLAAFWTYVDIMNVVTDMPLVILPAMIISKLHADRSRKAIVIACFAARVLVIGGSIAQLFYLHHDFSQGSDFTLQVWRSVLCTEVVIFLSFFTACIPYLKPLIEAMESGMIRGDDLRRRGQDHEAWTREIASQNHVRSGIKGMFSGGGGTSKNNTKVMSSKKATRMDNLSSDSSRSMSMQTMGPHQGSKHLTNTTISGGHLGHKSKSARATDNGIDDDGDSQSSQSKIIKKTMTFNISEEPQARMPDYLNGGYAR